MSRAGSEGSTQSDPGSARHDEADARLRLEVMSGPDAGRLLPLTAGERYIVGKDATASLPLGDPTVSRRHLVLEAHAGSLLLRDLRSKNGTFIGGVRVRECTLVPGVVLRVGATLIKVARADEECDAVGTATGFGRLRGQSARMLEVFATLRRIAPSTATVLIEGETGSGKELCASAIHAASRRAGSFVVFDVASASPSLIESELFGHVRGAFTGADSDRQGVFEEAAGGTLFLDEIGELDLQLQPRLLRAIHERQVRPIGAARYREVDVRLVAATHRDLRAEVEAGRFRADLYHRLAVIRVGLPPLRERKEDIDLLIDDFLRSQRRPVQVSPEAYALLNEYDWPGNVRELRNALERALSLLPADALTLTPELLGVSTLGAAHAGSWPELGDARFAARRDALVAAWERNYLQQLLGRNGDNVSQAAREAGMDRIMLHRLIRKHHLQLNSHRRGVRRRD